MSLLLRKSLSQAKFYLPGGQKTDTENIRLFFLPFSVPECGILPRLRHSFLLPFPFSPKTKKPTKNEEERKDSLLPESRQGKGLKGKQK